MIDLSTFTERDIWVFGIILFSAIVVMFLTRRLLRISFPYFFMGILGLVSGLWVGAKIGAPFVNLPSPYDRWIPMAINIIITVAFLDLFLAQARAIGRSFSYLFSLFQRWIVRATEFDIGAGTDIIVDTSALVDGRIEEISRTGFLIGRLVIPQFVLRELQTIADLEDPLKRARGRRGLETLSAIRRLNNFEVELTDEWLGGKEEIDAKLIRVAKKRNARILTVDYNLNQVAQIQGVTVLNINELASALRPQVIPGERMMVQILQKGKEKNQGVGYLPDGTMIVVENSADKIGQQLECEVVRIFQSVAGKMIFAELCRGQSSSNSEEIKSEDKKSE